ncbi:M14 family metallopeptidase [Marichromatium gracile]|uniref:M14 family metallopeptidase n=1 Tax=Marichromatium gracile TaxID=1048 RepID=UPI001F22DDDA|nr:M14 family metallopeptidase [Marichromatium gracile]MCF1184852.1 M14 family metallopeptidase [Marichromatium gracile]
MLQQLDHLPEGLLETPAPGLEALLGGPTLIHLPGQRRAPLFVSVLLHGNETVGWEAVRALLAARLTRYGALRLPRALSLFIGNVAAAAHGVRRLPGQPDYNRVWPGAAPDHGPEQLMMAQVVETMRARAPFASVDLHNNTGRNPHYGCVNVLEPRTLQLASLFARTLVYFTSPTGVQSQAFTGICPAVTVECGKVGEQGGVDHAREFVGALLQLAELPARLPAAREFDLFETVARARIPLGVHFGFPPEQADLVLDPALERLNFCELPAGMAFGRVRPGKGLCVEVHDAEGRDLSAQFFRISGEELLLRRPAMPSMLTRNEVVIRQDCLCYLMIRREPPLAVRDD